MNYQSIMSIKSNNNQKLYLLPEKERNDFSHLRKSTKNKFNPKRNIVDEKSGTGFFISPTSAAYNNQIIQVKT